METEPFQNPAIRPPTPVKTSWFEFLLDATLLEKHLNKPNPDPAPPDLIGLFLYQADVAATTAKDIRDGVTPEEALSQFSENKKVRSLKLLALKVAAHLRWNLDDLNKSIPLAMVQDILLELLRICLGESDADPAKHRDLNLTALSQHALFALQLYHRWCLKVLIEDSFPSRPRKALAVQVPGLEVPVLNPANGKETVMNIVREGESVSLSVLQSFLSMACDLLMPSLPSLGFVLHDSDTQTYDWERGLLVSSQEVVAQISHDAGSVHFHRQNYKQAYFLFSQAQETLQQLEAPVYCTVDKASLRGFIQACQTMVGPPQTQSLFEKVEETKKNKCSELVSLLQEDNQKRELSVSYRDALEEYVMTTLGKTSLYREVRVCNTVRRALDGRIEAFSLVPSLTAHSSLRKFTVKCLEQSMTGANRVQRDNLQTLARFLCLRLASESSFCKSLRRVMSLQPERVSDDMPTLDYTPVVGANEQSQVERQLLTTYDPPTIKELVQKLLNKTSKTHIMGLTDQWRIPRELAQPIDGLPIPWVQVYSYLLVAKSRVCVRLQMYHEAKQLLQAADHTIRDISYKLGKLLRWELLRVDLLHQETRPGRGEERKGDKKQEVGKKQDGKKQEVSGKQEVVKKVKACLTTIEGKHDILPAGDVLSLSVAFLINVREWETLQSLTSVNNGYVQIGRLVANVCISFTSEGVSYSQVAQAPARRCAKELWEAVTEIFTSSTQTKRTGTGSVTAMQRESNKGILPTEAFTDLLKNIKDEVALTALLSCLVNFWRMVKSDLSTEIQIEYQNLWPVTLPNVSAVMVPLLTNTISTLIEVCREVNPVQVSWLKTQADLCLAQGGHAEAVRHYLEQGLLAGAGTISTDQALTCVFEEQTVKKLIKCCSSLNYHTQVAVLCQCLDEIDYSTAFKALQESSTDDALDSYLPYLWDNTLLEFIINLHHRRGENDKKQLAIQTMGQLELNASNPPPVLSEAANRRKASFLQVLAKQYL